MKKVFLGGTGNESEWRKILIPMLEIDYFNPVVEDWTPECQKEEIEQRSTCDLLLYVITSKMTDVYAIAEAVQDSNKRPEKTVFCFLPDGFSEGRIKSLSAVGNLVERNGGKVCASLNGVAAFLNKFQENDKVYAPNLLQCLGKEPGSKPEQVIKAGVSYMFNCNDDGDYVCSVANSGHRTWFLKQSSFVVYGKTDQPEREFTEDEEEWMATWLNKGANNFLAFVNGRTHDFINARPKVQAIAHEKWKALLPKFKKCPFILDRDGLIPKRDMEPDTVPSPKDESTLASDASDEDALKIIKYQKKATYADFVDRNEDYFMNTSDEVEDYAIAKWNRFYTENTWPYVAFWSGHQHEADPEKTNNDEVKYGLDNLKKDKMSPFIFGLEWYFAGTIPVGHLKQAQKNWKSFYPETPFPYTEVKTKEDVDESTSDSAEGEKTT